MSVPDIVLVSPQIPQNTGTIARTCAGLRNRLHIVRPCGFQLDSRYLKRAGLDYWPSVKLCVHESWDDFLNVQTGHAVFMSTRGKKDLTQFGREDVCRIQYLVFGSESSGFPPELYERYRDQLTRLPLDAEHIRSFNLAVAVGMALGICLSRLTTDSFSGSRSKILV